MQHLFRLLLLFCVLIGSITTRAQQPTDLKGKKLGFFIDSKTFSFDETYYLPAAEFLKVEEDRSAGAKVKNELMVRLGEIFVDQLQAATEADTVIFLNADLRRGKAFREVYTSGSKRMVKMPAALQGIDEVWVMGKMELTSRRENLSYIRSNRIVTQRLVVKVGQMQMVHFTLGGNNSAGETTQIIFDARKSTCKVPRTFDFFADSSSLGKFFSDLFSNWWSGYQQGISNQECR
ncbi:MAG: hypothetical protein AAGI38_17770 [Bacteroidota bacterium]